MSNPVQSKGNHASAISATLAFTSNVTAGDAIIVAVGGPSMGTGFAGVASVTDSQGNTYGRDVFAGTGTPGAYVYSTPSAASTGPCTVTISVSLSTSFSFSIAELSGSYTLDQSNEASGTSASPAPGSITTTVASEYVAAVCAVASGGAINTIPSGYTNLQNDPGIAESCYKNLSSTGSENPTWALLGSAGWAAVVASYKASGGGGGGSQVPFARRAAIWNDDTGFARRRSTASDGVASLLYPQPPPSQPIPRLLRAPQMFRDGEFFTMPRPPNIAGIASSVTPPPTPPAIRWFIKF